jgi:hypothetical protein
LCMRTSLPARYQGRPPACADLMTTRFRDDLIAEGLADPPISQSVSCSQGKRRPEPTSTILAGPGQGVTSAARLDRQLAVRRGLPVHPALDESA